MIYGINSMGMDSKFALELELPVVRWGGEDKTRFNWKTSMINGVIDWFFENYIGPAGAADDFTAANLKTKTDMLFTVPAIGWMTKEPANISDSSTWPCSYSISKYNYTALHRYWSSGTADPSKPDCGSGVVAYGQWGSDIYLEGNDPMDTSFKVDSSWTKEWVEHIVKKFGSGAVRYYNLDNEPDIWHQVHTDVRRKAVTYDEMVNLAIDYIMRPRSRVLTARPQIFGPYFTDVREIYNSPLDIQNGDKADRLAHGNLTFVEYYLQQLKKAEQTYKKRLLDYYDIHFYSQASGIQAEDGGDAATQQLRLRATRSLWDPTYDEENWLAQNTPSLEGSASLHIIPRLLKLIDQNYPGTKLAISEYCWGGRNHRRRPKSSVSLGALGSEWAAIGTFPGCRQYRSRYRR